MRVRRKGRQFAGAWVAAGDGREEWFRRWQTPHRLQADTLRQFAAEESADDHPTDIQSEQCA